MESGVNFMVPHTKPTIVFATMCKNEEHCIKATLNSVYKYIDYWVVHDTGSTDNTCQIVKDFFDEKKIPGELFVGEWKGFDYNKTQLFSRCEGKGDYILHIDADDLIVGDFKFTTRSNYDAYYLTTRRHTVSYKCLVLWKNNLRWKFCGVAHTTVKSLVKPEGYSTTEELVCDNVYLHSRDDGSRSNDPLKYFNDGEKLKKQFFDTLYQDPDELNNRSVFYTAQSYLDAQKPELALQWYCLYLKLKDTWIEEVFESHLKIAKILIDMKKSYDEIAKYIYAAIKIYPDRAEPYYILGKHCNYIQRQEEAYGLLKKALSMNFEKVNKKYVDCLFLNHRMENIYMMN